MGVGRAVSRHARGRGAIAALHHLLFVTRESRKPCGPTGTRTPNTCVQNRSDANFTISPDGDSGVANPLPRRSSTPDRHSVQFTRDWHAARSRWADYGRSSVASPATASPISQRRTGLGSHPQVFVEQPSGGIRAPAPKRGPSIPYPGVPLRAPVVSGQCISTHSEMTAQVQEGLDHSLPTPV